MIDKLTRLDHLIGRTPLQNLCHEDLKLYAKLEYNNFSGSIKDRAAYNVILEGIKDGQINKDTSIIESSSGNFGISLAMICKHLGLKFTVVIDPNINHDYERLLRLLNCEIVKVDALDRTGGYLLNRIAKVNEICLNNPNMFWTNQYENPNNYKAYYNGLAEEIVENFKILDYLFVAVSSGGTIAGLSLRLKEIFPKLKVIAVDIEGSIIFGGVPQKRRISGIGSSKRPKIIDSALIDEVIHVTEVEIVMACNNLVRYHGIFGGASCGAAYHAICKYHKLGKLTPASYVLFLCPDKGYSYLDTVYSPAWLSNFELKSPDQVEELT